MPLDENLIHQIVQLTKERMTRRAIARALHVSRNTVRQILAEHGEARTREHTALARPPLRRRCSKLDSFRPKIDELLREYADITAQRVFEILREQGFDGGYTGVKELVRRVRPKPAPKASLETSPREPGDMAECDWSPYKVNFTNAAPMTLQAFGYTLRYSTRKFYSFHEGNGLHPLMDGHLHAFARFGGAARRCKYDNQKPVVLRWEGGQPIYNPRFIDFATYYEFSPVACRPKHPNDKPRVERSFYELVLSFFRGRSFRDKEDLEGQLTHWMDAIADVRPIKSMRRHTRLELFAEELALMRPLPCHPYDTARVLYKLCDIEGFIAWEGNWYSLPYEYVTDILPVRVTENELLVYKADLTCVARHPLLPRGAQRRSVLDGHRPRYAERGPDLDQLRRAFDDLGEPAAAFLAALEKRESRSAGYHARKVLALREGYDTADLLKALSHALAYGALEHTAIERILLARASRRRLDEYVADASAKKLERALSQSCTEPRDLAEYDELPCANMIPKPQGEASCPNETTASAEARPEKPASGSNNTSNDSAS
jgi:transposase